MKRKTLPHNPKYPLKSFRVIDLSPQREPSTVLLPRGVNLEDFHFEHYRDSAGSITRATHLPTGVSYYAGGRTEIRNKREAIRLVCEELVRRDR